VRPVVFNKAKLAEAIHEEAGTGPSGAFDSDITYLLQVI